MSKFFYDAPSEWELKYKESTTPITLSEEERAKQDQDAVISNTAKYMGWSALQGFADTTLAVGQFISNKLSDPRELARAVNSSSMYYGLSRDQIINELDKHKETNKWITNEEVKESPYYTGVEHREGISDWALKAEWARNKISEKREESLRGVEEVSGKSTLLRSAGFATKVATSLASPEAVLGFKASSYLSDSFNFGKGLIGSTGKYATMIAPFAAIGGGEEYLKEELATHKASFLDFAKSFAMTEAFAPVFAVGGKVVGSAIKPMIGSLYNRASHELILKETVEQMANGILPRIDTIINNSIEKKLPELKEAQEAGTGIIEKLKEQSSAYKTFISELSNKYSLDVQNTTKKELRALSKQDLNQLYKETQKVTHLLESYDGLQDIKALHSYTKEHAPLYQEQKAVVDFLSLSQEKAEKLKDGFGAEAYILDDIVKNGYQDTLSKLSKVEKPDTKLLNKIMGIRDADISEAAVKKAFGYNEYYGLPKTSLEGLQAVIGGTARRKLGRDSADLHVQSKTGVYFQQLVDKLQKHGAGDIFLDSQKLDKEIITKLFNRSLDQTTDSGKIATGLSEMFDYLLNEYHKIGIPIKESWSGYIGKMRYDQLKVGWSDADLKNFATNTEKYIDYDRSFPGKTKKEITAHLNEIFNNIKDGSFMSPGAENKYKLLHPKDAESAIEWLKLYGKGNNLLDVVSETIKGVAREVGIIERLGSNPKNTFDKIINAYKEQGKISTVNTFVQNNVFNELIGNQKLEPFKSFTNKVFAWEYITKTQNIALASQADMNNTMTVLQKVFGESVLGAVKQGVVKQEAKYIEQIISDIGHAAGYKATSSDLRDTSLWLKYLARSRIERTGTDLMSKLSTFHGKASGIDSWDVTLLKEQGGDYVARSLYRAAIGDRLNPALTETLKSYNITKTDLEFIKANAEFDGKLGYASIIGLNNPTNESVASYLGKNVATITEKDIKGVSSQVSERVSTMFSDAMNYFRLTPDAVDRAMFTKLSDNPVFRSVTMFHGFSFSAARRVLTLSFEGMRDARNFEELLGGAAKDVPVVFRHLVGSFILGYASLSLKRLADGLMPLDVRDPMSWWQAFVYGGGAAIYADYGKFFERGVGGLRYKVPALLGAPINTVIQTVDTAIEAGKAVFDEDRQDKSISMAYRHAKSNIPAISYPYIKAAFNMIFGWKLMKTLAPNAFEKMMDYREGLGQIINPEDYAH